MAPYLSDVLYIYIFYNLHEVNIGYCVNVLKILSYQWGCILTHFYICLSFWISIIAAESFKKNYSDRDKGNFVRISNFFSIFQLYSIRIISYQFSLISRSLNPRKRFPLKIINWTLSMIFNFQIKSTIKAISPHVHIRRKCADNNRGNFCIKWIVCQWKGSRNERSCAG